MHHLVKSLFVKFLDNGLRGALALAFLFGLFALFLSRLFLVGAVGKHALPLFSGGVTIVGIITPSPIAAAIIKNVAASIRSGIIVCFVP